VKEINNLALKGEVCCSHKVFTFGVLYPLSALKLARESVQKVLNTSARIKTAAAAICSLYIPLCEKYPFESRESKEELSRRHRDTKNTKLLFDIF